MPTNHYFSQFIKTEKTNLITVNIHILLIIKKKYYNFFNVNWLENNTFFVYFTEQQQKREKEKKIYRQYNSKPLA